MRSTRRRVIGLGLLAGATGCFGCKQERWAGTDEVVLQLRCGMPAANVQSLAEGDPDLKWFVRDGEPWDKSLVHGNTSIHLEFDQEGLLRGYEILWDADFMYTEVEDPVALCSESPPKES